MGTTIAIPYLSRKGEDIYREGLGKFLGMMISGILAANPDVSIEIWAYSQGVAAIRHLFKDQLEKNPDCIRIIDDFSAYQRTGEYRSRVAKGESADSIREGYENETKLQKGFFLKAFNLNSFRHRKFLLENIKAETKADFIYYFCVNYVPLIGVSKPTLIQVHDLFTMQYEKLFASDKKRYLLTNRAIQAFLGVQSLRGAHFVCSSNNTRERQCLKYIPFVREKRVHLVRFPAMVKDYDGSVETDRETFCEKFSITAPYIAYPTQNRPNKNILTLLKAMKILRARDVDIRLAITGHFNDVEECKAFIEENPEIADMLVETGSLSEEDLFLFYKHSAMVASSSFIEGACVSGQVLEALKIGDVPVIHALSDGIDEWLEVHRFTKETADMNWFERFDHEHLAQLIEDVLENREAHVSKQAHIYNDIQEPGWGETGTNYLELLKSMI